mmetsp:Transcript_127/g.132  ORF Transcript_127/g.132 Transcript_127/m.132 type:complete len:584 (+) Transcript_127:78-1829(+)
MMWNSTAYYDGAVDLTEPSLEMIVGLVVTVLALMIASAGGIGGGGILVPIFILLLRWSPRYAIPLSNITILGGAIMNTGVNLSKRHPLANRPLIDWDLVLIMEPLTILGALFGSFLNQLLPEFVLILLLAILLAATAKRTMKKGFKLWKQESKENRLRRDEGDGTNESAGDYMPVSKSEQPSREEAVGTEGSVLDVMELHQSVGSIATPHAVAAFSPLRFPEALEKGDPVLCQRSSGEWCHSRVHSYDAWPSEGGTLTLQVDKYRRKVLDLSKRRHLSRVLVAEGNASNDLTANKRKNKFLIQEGNEDDEDWDGEGGAPVNEKLVEILEAESKHSKSKICVLFLAFVGVLFFDLAKEYSKCGSYIYWLSAFLTIPWTLIFFFGYRRYLIRLDKDKRNLGFEFVEGDVRWDSRSTFIYPVLCVFAGFFAGMFGVGGGIIKGPLMLEMGILPIVASANAATMILFTAGTAALSFILFGAVDRDTGILLFVVGIVATGVGQFFLGIAIKRANRQSLVVLSMGSVVVLSAILLTMRSIVEVATKEGGYSTLTALGSICHEENLSDQTAPTRVDDIAETQEQGLFRFF